MIGFALFVASRQAGACPRRRNCPRVRLIPRSVGRPLLVVLALLAPAAAQTVTGAAVAPASVPAPLLFPTVVVEATGYGTPPIQMPYSTSVLTPDAMNRRLPRSLPGALEELPGVMIQKTGTGQAAPYLRGFTGFRTLLLVNGIRLNNSVFREGPNQYWGTIDPFSVGQLEVIKGPSSVIYGSDAIGGTVNAVSVGPTLAGTGVHAGGRALYRYTSADDSHTGRVEATGGIGRTLGAHLGVTRRTVHDLRAGSGSGLQPKTGFTESAVDAAVAYQLGEHTRVTARWQDFSQDDAWRTHSTIFGSTWEGTHPGSDLQRSLDQQRRLLAVQLHADRLDGPVQQVQVSVSHQAQQEDQHRLRGDRRREDTGFDVGTLGAFVQAQGGSAVGRWHFGGEFYRDRVDSYSTRYRADGTLAQVDIQGPVADDAAYDLAGGYVENRLPRFGPVDLVVGARYNHAAADAERVRDPVTDGITPVASDWHSFVGSIRGVVHLGAGERQNVFAGVSQAFRAPNLSDLTRFDIAEGGQIETPAPLLEPERFLTAEAGWRTRRDRWSAGAAWFHTAIRNQIIRTPTGARIDGLEEVTKRNSGAGFVHGVELAGSVRPAPDWTLSGVATWMEGELDYHPTADSSRLVRAPLSRVMPLTGHLHLRWEPPAMRVWAGAAAGAAARQDRLAPGDRVDTERIPPGGTSGYVFASLRGGWRPTRALTLAIALENLTDEDYRIHGSGVNEPGRNLVFSADYRF
jgi:hemoglobin/transferrin/lactoferrin receptor protein